MENRRENTMQIDQPPRVEEKAFQHPKDKRVPPLRTGAEMQRLIHQLSIHQIELEAQNSELRLAREELELSRNKYLELYDFAPSGYLTFDEFGNIRGMNLVGGKMLGMERQALLGKSFYSLIADSEDRGMFSDHLDRVLREHEVQHCEIRLTGKGGEVIHGLLQSVHQEKTEKEGAAIFTSVVDGTVAKRLADELQRANESLEANVCARTAELTGAIASLNLEIGEHRAAEESLKGALVELARLKNQFQEENISLKREMSQPLDSAEIVGASEALSKVFSKVDLVAGMNATVLLLGETGTGKGLIARAIHKASARKDRPMLTINCAVIPANLFESELFGRERGAFTGATAHQMGRFELADGGTILLDEIGEMPLELQPKLLRVLQDGEFERLGSPRTIKVDVRIIAATNRNLEEEVRNHRFREDLYYRLNVFPITIPPLRQRKEDIPPLVSHFVSKYNKKTGKKIETVSKETMNALGEYHWPGNVRELESVVERAVITSQRNSLQILDRFDNIPITEAFNDDSEKTLANLERDHILQILQKTGWRIDGKKGAALVLGINPSTLRARMRKLLIQRN